MRARAVSGAAIHQPPRPDASTLSVGVLVLGSCVLTASRTAAMAWVVAAAIAVLVVRERHGLPRRQLAVSLATGAIGVALLPLADHAWLHAAEGLRIGSTFLALMASVSFLAAAARRSPPIRRTAEELLGRGPQLGGLPVVAVAHLFPALLNIAGTAILCEMASTAARPAHPPAQLDQAVFSAIHRGFVAAVCWSPMFGNMALLLALYPTLDWPDVAPLGLVAGGLCSLMTLAVGPLRRVSGGWTGAGRELTTLVRLMVPLVLGMVVFLAASLAVHKAFAVPTALAITVLAPLFALLWNRWDVGSVGGAAARMLGDARAAFPRMAPEALFFACAGFMAVMVGAVLPQDLITAAAQPLHGHAVLALSLLLGANIAMALIGVHPVVTALLLATALPPDTLGLAPLPHFMAVLVGWGVAFSISPFTLTSAMIARYTGHSPFVVAYRWNALFAAAMLAVVLPLLWMLAVMS